MFESNFGFKIQQIIVWFVKFYKPEWKKMAEILFKMNAENARKWMIRKGGMG